jgi:DNA-binding NarL/FixJ family response regulator
VARDATINIAARNFSACISRFEKPRAIVTVGVGEDGVDWVGASFGGGSRMISILLADEQVVVRRGLRSLLEERADFKICAETGNGRDAVELVLRHKPDIAVLDITLPLLDGISATRRIRKLAPATEVLIFTVHDGKDAIREAIGAGATGYVLKSESDDQIVKAVESLAQHHAFFSSGISDALLVPSVEAGHDSPAVNLTSREREVVQLVAEGNSNKMVAKALDISVKTVETHRAAAMHKLGIHSTAELVRYAIRKKLVEP